MNQQCTCSRLTLNRSSLPRDISFVHLSGVPSPLLLSLQSTIGFLDHSFVSCSPDPSHSQLKQSLTRRCSLASRRQYRQVIPLKQYLASHRRLSCRVVRLTPAPSCNGITVPLVPSQSSSRVPCTYPPYLNNRGTLRPITCPSGSSYFPAHHHSGLQ